MGYKTGAITYEFETKTFNYDRGIRLFADVMGRRGGGRERLLRGGRRRAAAHARWAPEADAFTFAQIASHTGVTVTPEDLSEATATDILQALRDVTSAMDEKQVTLGSRYLFITPTLKGVLDDFSYANPTHEQPSLEHPEHSPAWSRCRRCAFTPRSTSRAATPSSATPRPRQARRSTSWWWRSPRSSSSTSTWRAACSPRDELESLDSYMMKYRKYGIVEFFDNKLDGVYVSVATE